MFVKKTIAELKAMDENAVQSYYTEKEAHEAELNAKAIKDALEPLETKLTKATADLEQAGLKITELETKGMTKDAQKTFVDEFIENVDEVKSIVKAGHEKEMVIKAPTLIASITGNTDAVKLTGIGQLGRKARSLYNFFRKTQVGMGDHNGTVRYHDWDEATSVKAAATIAEGAVFPESTAVIVEYKVDLKKIGDTLPVSEEFGEDAVSAANELNRFVELNVDNVIDTQIAVGSGLTTNLKGLFTTAPSYTPVASGIVDANIYDLCKKMRTAITKNRGSKYSPDFVVMNADTIDRLVLKKDANNNYIFPDRENIGSMIILEDNNIADNTLVIGDSRYAEIFEMGGAVLSRNYSGNQFVTDQITIKVRKRLLFLIRNVDQTGFLKCTNVTTALTTLATP